MDASTDIFPFARDAVALEGDTDATFMRRAMDLAWTAAGATTPNPMVGAVVVRGGEVVGEGVHRRCGESHAEVVALDAAGDRARGATLYVNLEPCVHHGRTPPCTDAIIAAGVARAVIPALDADARVCGRGIATLREAGITVDVGSMADAAVVQNLSYYRRQLGLGTTVTLKMAATRNGMIASGPGRRDAITGEAATHFVHGLRALHDCVVVGAETARVDEPSLDLRHYDGVAEMPASPLPVVLDTHLRLDTNNRWTRDGKEYVVICANDAPEEHVVAFEKNGARILRCDADETGLVPAAVVEALASIGCERIMVEGGAAVFTSFMKSGTWDAFYLLRSEAVFDDGAVPMHNGGDDLAAEAEQVEVHRLGEDTAHWFANRRSLAAVKRLLAERGGV